VYSFFDKAEFDRLLNRCLEQFPNHPRANYIMGINLREKERFSEAIDYYKKAIENYPKTDRYHLNEAYNNIGTVYYDLKNYKEAVKRFKEYTAKKPDPTAYYLIGYSLYKLGKFSEADDYFREAFFIDPDFSLKKVGLVKNLPE